MKNSTAPLFLLAWLALALFSGCQKPVGDYLAAASISRNGFATDPAAIRKMHGHEAKFWGFVDHGNLYGDQGAKEILREWWSGNGPDAKTWRFNLKARADDPVGYSFAVDVANGPGRDALLKTFVDDARARRPTKVFVTGMLVMFAAPMNGFVRTGLSLKVASSLDIQLRPDADAFSGSPIPTD